MSMVYEIAPNDPCDRCGHVSKFHAGPDKGSRCMVVGAKVWHGERIPAGMRAKACPCDGFFPKP